MLELVRAARAQRTRTLAAQTAAQARLTWASNALIRQGFGPTMQARDLTILTGLGVAQADAERTIHQALAAAASAYRVQMAVCAAALASDSENADTGKMSALQ